ncbi:MAG: glycoside hydrolase family 65 protein [Clostridia bacterium]|nr:glycoside hydrolase family 65 protein [Clostridia bacterium]
MNELKESGFDAAKTVENGNKYLLGNGYLGYRGTLDEFGASECVGLNIAGKYDGVKGKWRETVNAFNPFYMAAYAGGIALDAREKNVAFHEVALDIFSGLFKRKTVFDVNGTSVTLKCERFVNMASKSNLCSRVIITADKDIRLNIKAGVDTDIWELNGPHFKDVKTKISGDTITASGTTQELGYRISVECKYSQRIENFSGGFGYINADIKKGEKFVLDRVAFVLFGEENADGESYDDKLKSHLKEWERLWSISRVYFKDDKRAQFALDYSIYHLLILAPKGEYSIAARGLSGQTYKGAVFWDTEIFMLPFFLNTLPDCAKNLIKYRINTLPEAKKKAQSYGYGGAFYAWESQDGYDACSDFNVTDVFTHRPVRTYFKDKQIHISADVAYAILKYYEHTGDDELMLAGGLETVLECAEFARTYSYYNHVKDRYELLDVIGPDEYHERVNNNAYTNYIFYNITKRGVELYEKFKKAYPESAVKKLKEWVEKLYLPKPDKNGVIEQFDGYFKLEDVEVEEVRSRLKHPNEYWGGSGGVATATRVIKQADVIMLFNLYPGLFSKEVQKANYEFYLPYTEHGSSLSHCAYALTACRIGKTDGAYKAFMDSAEIDLKGGGKQWAGEIYIGGTHPAASGGAWMTAVYGFGCNKEKK